MPDPPSTMGTSDNIKRIDLGRVCKQPQFLTRLDLAGSHFEMMRVTICNGNEGQFFDTARGNPHLSYLHFKYV